MIIQAIQFLRPHGEPREVTGLIDDSLRSQWKAVQRYGLRLTLEMVTGGSAGTLISVCLEHSLGDYAQDLVPNGPQVTEAIEALIRDFNPERFEAWRQEEQRGDRDPADEGRKRDGSIDHGDSAWPL